MSTTTIVMEMIFQMRLFLYSPTTSFSFSSKMRKTNAAGRRVTAMTCTIRVIVTRGAPGMRTMAAANAQHEKPEYREPWRLSYPIVQRVRPAEHLSEGPGARKGDCYGTKQAGVKEPYGHEGPHVAVYGHQKPRSRGRRVNVSPIEKSPGDDY